MLPLFLSILFLFLATLSPAKAMGSATVTNFCPFEIWCAKTRGFEANGPTPISDRPPPNWLKMTPGSSLSGTYDEMAPKTPMTIQCTRDKTAAVIQVTQLEWNWDPAMDRRVWFDVSVVAGTPFLNGGFALRADGTTVKPFETCFGGGCAPGEKGWGVCIMFGTTMKMPCARARSRLMSFSTCAGRR
jgi:hypothetical protein